ncbi:MAG: toprim domain-containing protein, partial [Fidelibacterota bacterium]
SREALNQSGLFATSEKGTFDRFRSRIIFPITNIAGRVVAFGGRVFNSDDPAKYVNSPETPVYHKGEILYGFSLTRNVIRDQETAIIVEGYLDLIQLYQAGLENIVAVSGTALTDHHARELRKLTPNVFLAYDGDTAGVQAAIRGGYTLLRNGLSPRVVPMPSDMDPDDWVQKEGTEPLLKAVEAAEPLLEFHLQHFQGDLTQAGDMRRFLDEALQELVQISDPLVRELHLKRLADLTGLDERPIREAFRRIPRVRPRDSAEDEPAQKGRVIIESTGSHRAQMSLIRLAFQEDDRILNLLLDQAAENIFTHPVLRSIWQVVDGILQQSTVPDPSSIMDQLSSEEERQVLSQVLMADEVLAGEADKEQILSLAIDCVTLLRRDSLQQRIEQRRIDLRQAEKQSGESPVDIIAEVTALQRELANLGQQFEKYR